jgi:circadian clock protein KaiB
MADEWHGGRMNLQQDIKPQQQNDDIQALECALAAEPSAARYCLRLFVSGHSLHSIRAIRNIKALCDEKLNGRYDLEVIDIYRHPERLKADQVLTTPTLVKKLPLPIRQIIGDLSDRERVSIGLEISG